MWRGASWIASRRCAAGDGPVTRSLAAVPAARRSTARSTALRSAVAALVAALWALALPAAAAASTVRVVRVEGDINAAAADFLEREITASMQSGATALVVELDTPGGYLDATKDIVSDILNARVPVVVFVAPRGAWAGSAGTFITLAGHVAAMAPGTTIGAAHPVLIGQEQPQPPPAPYEPDGKDGEKPPRPPPTRDVMGEKMENFAAAFIESIATQRGRNAKWAIDAVRRSVAVTQQQALEQKVIDLVAEDLDDLLDKIDGREVEVAGGKVVLATRGARIERIEMSPLDRFYAFLTDPTILSLLLMGGLLGLYMELSNPGGIVPGALGAVCLILAGFGMQAIPFNALGAVLMAIGLGLMGAELFVPAFGALFAAGIACLGVGGYLLFDVPELGPAAFSFWTEFFPGLVVVAVVGAVMVFYVSRSVRVSAFAGSGAEGLIGQLARADSDLDPAGRVFLQGEFWNAEASQRVRRGERVRVEGIRDLVLRVSPAPDAEGGER
jgi:membrane-bound serine protease (ClpP class)